MELAALEKTIIFSYCKENLGAGLQEIPPARPLSLGLSSLSGADQGEGKHKELCGQITPDASSQSLMREEPSQLIPHDKLFQRITLSKAGQTASCLACRYKCLLWVKGGWFGQGPEAFNIPFAQQEAQSHT